MMTMAGGVHSNSKSLIYVLAVIVIIVALVALAVFYINPKSSHNATTVNSVAGRTPASSYNATTIGYNASAVSQNATRTLTYLNGRILAYGSNLRYMLANRSAYYAAFGNQSASVALYANLTEMANDSQSLSSALKFIGASSSSANNTYLYFYNPLVRIKELNTLSTTGFVIFNTSNHAAVTTQNLSKYSSQLLVPENVSDLQSLFELKGYGINTLLVASTLESLFKIGYFNGFGILGSSSGNATISKLPSETNPDMSLALLPSDPQMMGTIALTTILNGSIYDSVSGAGVQSSWIVLGEVTSLGSGFKGVNNATYLNKLFYKLSLDQYATYEMAQMLYNRSIGPNIDFFGYINDTALINLGNMNPADQHVSLYIDGNQVNYTRYYNYLIVYNEKLGVGYHTVKAVIDNSTLSANAYIEPAALPEDILVNQYFNSPSSYLTFTIRNIFSAPLNITNVSVTRGIASSFYSGTDIGSFKFINITQMANTTPLKLINATYSSFNYIKVTNGQITANSTTYGISGTEYNIRKDGDAVTLYYNLGNECPAEQDRTYTLTFDTNYGSARYLLFVVCS